MLWPAAATATYDAANRLSSWNAAAITYDANGNMLSDGSRSYSWDARNRLAGITGAASASFQYDAFGRRIAKTVNGVQTGFLYDGLNPVQELNGATPTANLLTGLNIDEYYRRTDTTGARDILTDALGSVIALTDSLARVKTQYTYSPYGETTASGEANANALQYTGRENDGTGLYFYRARYYDPGIGRFVSEDPIGLAGGINVYAYVGGNPVSYIDPLGLFCLSQKAINAIGGAAGGAFGGGASLSNFGMPGIIAGAVLGALGGGLAGYAGTNASDGGAMASGAASGGLASANTPLSGAVGGAVGAGVASSMASAGAPANVVGSQEARSVAPRVALSLAGCRGLLLRGRPRGDLTAYLRRLWLLG